MKRTAAFLTCLLVLGGCNPGTETSEEAVDASAAAGGDEWCELTYNYEKTGECARLQQQYGALDAGVDAFRPAEEMTADETTVVTYAVKRLPNSVQGENGELATAAPVPEPTPEPTETPTENATPTEDATDAAVDVEAGAESGELGEAASAAPTGPTQEEIDSALDTAGQRVSEIVVADEDAAQVTVGQIKMGRLMFACLEGDPTFRIEPEKCQTLNTLEKPEAVWRWQVTPTEPGDNFELSLTSGIELTTSDGKPRRIGQPGRSAEIDVKVTALGRWKRALAQAEEWIRSPLGVIAALTALAGAIGLLIGAIRRARRGEGPEPTPEGDDA